MHHAGKLAQDDALILLAGQTLCDILSCPHRFTGNILKKYGELLRAAHVHCSISVFLSSRTIRVSACAQTCISTATARPQTDYA